MDPKASPLHSSFEIVLARDPSLKGEFYDAFYRKLFTLYPPTWGMFFRTPAAMQEQMLHETMLAMVEHIDDEVWLHDKLRAMGAKHKEYAVKPEMYVWMRAALLETLADMLGPAWNQETERAWSEAFDAITAVMLGGAATAAAAPHP
jgi:hemoglobin-like flavoprotein